MKETDFNEAQESKEENTGTVYAPRCKSSM